MPDDTKQPTPEMLLSDPDALKAWVEERRGDAERYNFVVPFRKMSLALDLIEKLAAERDALRIALRDAINCPRGVVPLSAEPIYAPEFSRLGAWPPVPGKEPPCPKT